MPPQQAADAAITIANVAAAAATSLPLTHRNNNMSAAAATSLPLTHRNNNMSAAATTKPPRRAKPQQSQQHGRRHLNNKLSPMARQHRNKPLPP
jgi:hypothetical protein